MITGINIAPLFDIVVLLLTVFNCLPNSEDSWFSEILSIYRRSEDCLGCHNTMRHQRRSDCGAGGKRPLMPNADGLPRYDSVPFWRLEQPSYLKSMFF